MTKSNNMSSKTRTRPNVHRMAGNGATYTG